MNLGQKPFFDCKGAQKRFNAYLALPLDAFNALNLLIDLYSFEEQNSCEINIIATEGDISRALHETEHERLYRSFNYYEFGEDWLEFLYKGAFYEPGPLCVVCARDVEVYRGLLDYSAISRVLKARSSLV